MKLTGKIWSAVLIVLLCSARAFSQGIVVKSVVVDSTRTPIIGAIVKISTATDSVRRSTDINGNFSVPNIRYPQFKLTVSFIGHTPFVKNMVLSDLQKNGTLDTIELRQATNSLAEIRITAEVPLRVKEDTLEFSAASFPTRDGDAVEEVVKKLPGVVVEKDGSVTVNGKPLARIRVNGKDFFGTDVATALQSLPADIVKNLQIIDDFGDQAKITGIKTGEPEKILNINIDPEREKGYTARGTAGLGSADRFIANMQGNFMNGERHITVNADINNTNTRGGGGDGITDKKVVTLNYRNQLTKKLSADGGINYFSSTNRTFSTTNRQSIYDSFTRFDDQFSNNLNENSNASIWGNLEFKPDTLNYVKFTPNLSFNNSDNTGLGQANTRIQQQASLRDSRSLNLNRATNMGFNVFANHKFAKTGRNVSLSLNANFNTNNSDRDARNNYVNTDSLGMVTNENQYQLTGNDNASTRYASSFTFTEPFGKSIFADLNYNWNYTDNKADKAVRDVDAGGNEVFNDGLSNRFRYQFITNRVGLSVRKVHAKYNFNVGVSMQPAVLKGQNLTRNVATYKETFIVIPNARYVYRFSKQKTLTVNYWGRSNQPSFNQLQPITDNSNLRNTVTGNPDLKPEFINGVNANYNQANWGKEGLSISANAAYNRTGNRIVTTRTIIPAEIRQVTSYINTDGYYRMDGDYNIEKPILERKLLFGISQRVNFRNEVGFSNMQRNVAKNLTVDQGFKVRLDIQDRVDAEVNANYGINTVKYTLAGSTDRKTNTFRLNTRGTYYFFEDLGYNVSQEINSGFSASTNANPTLVRASVEYRFMKGNAARIRFEGFDLLNQSTGITRDVFDNEIVDRRVNRLARYFLLTMSYRVRKFGVK